MFLIAFTTLIAALIGTALWRLRHATGADLVPASAWTGALGGGAGGDPEVLRLQASHQSGGSPSPADRGGTPLRVSVVVPALNEEESIDWVIDHIPDWASEIVLVDGLSIDGTELVVTDRRDDVVIVHQRSRGKGAALRAGFAAATGDIIVMIDADGSTDPREMGRFVDALIAGADFVKGSRNLPGGGSVDFTRLRHLGNLGFVYAANLLFGVRFTDLCYGYCAFWRRDLDRLALTADGFEIEMQLILSAVKAGLTVTEVPSLELERRAGTSNLNAWTDGKRVLKTLGVERLRRLDPHRADAFGIALAPVKLAGHGSEQWVPAGSDRRNHMRGERRTAQDADYAGPERRSGSRRNAPDVTVDVLIAHDVSAVVGPPAPQQPVSPKADDARITAVAGELVAQDDETVSVVQALREPAVPVGRERRSARGSVRRSA